MLYTKTHEWIKIDADTGVVGITDHAQEALGDIVFIELPEVGRECTAGEELGVIESVKAASDYYTPMSGTVTEVNSAVLDSPEQVNQDAESAGWLFKIKLSNPKEADSLLSKESYLALEA